MSVLHAIDYVDTYQEDLEDGEILPDGFNDDDTGRPDVVSDEKTKKRSPVRPRILIVKKRERRPSRQKRDGSQYGHKKAAKDLWKSTDPTKCANVCRYY